MTDLIDTGIWHENRFSQTARSLSNVNWTQPIERQKSGTVARQPSCPAILIDDVYGALVYKIFSFL